MIEKIRMTAGFGVGDYGADTTNEIGKSRENQKFLRVVVDSEPFLLLATLYLVTE